MRLQTCGGCLTSAWLPSGFRSLYRDDAAFPDSRQLSCWIECYEGKSCEKLCDKSVWLVFRQAGSQQRTEKITLWRSIWYSVDWNKTNTLMIITQMPFSASNQQHLIASDCTATFYLHSCRVFARKGSKLLLVWHAVWQQNRAGRQERAPGRPGPQTTTKKPYCHLHPIWKLNPTHATAPTHPTETYVCRHKPTLTYTNTHPGINKHPVNHMNTVHRRAKLNCGRSVLKYKPNAAN